MIDFCELGTRPFTRFRALQTLIVNGDVSLAGYKRGKIYGTMACKTGKRMKPENRVLFKDEQEAINAGYRPCGHCMSGPYNIWKKNKIDSFSACAQNTATRQLKTHRLQNGTF